MSAIVKNLLGAVAATAIMATGAVAQDMTADFFSELTSEEASKPRSEEEILQTIEKMMKDVSEMKILEGSDENITIEEIDRRNREAQRLKNDITLRELRFSEMKAQVEMLLTLNDAKKQVLGPSAQGAQVGPDGEPVIPDQSSDDEGMSEEEKAQQAEQKAFEAATMREQMSVPRVLEIIGSGGHYESVIISTTGVRQTVEIGDNVINGFKVIDIDSKGVTLEGQQTGTKYFTAPSGYAPDPVQQNQQPSEALDMSTMPFPGMF
jgi:hypothetical protein